MKDRKKKEKARKIDHLGLHEDGFWVWGNGVLDNQGKFIEADENDLVEVAGKVYRLPWLDIEDDSYLLDDKNSFRHIERDVSLSIWGRLMLDVYGENAMIGISYCLAALFMDLYPAPYFPLLYIGGVKGSGKTSLARSLMALMGRPSKGPDLANMNSHMLREWLHETHNGFVHIDEFRNDATPGNIALLRDAPKDCDCGVILTGQDSRVSNKSLPYNTIHLKTEKSVFDDKEKELYIVLQDYQRFGLSSITNQLLGYRTERLAGLINRAWADRLTSIEHIIDIKTSDSRMLDCWLGILAVIYALTECGVLLPWGYNGIKGAFLELMVKQPSTAAGDR